MEFNTLNSPFNISELKAVIKSKQNDSAPGPDDITYPYFKALNDENLAILLDIYNYGYQNTCWNFENNRGVIVTIPKKDIFRGDPQELRPITLLQSYRKFLPCFLLTGQALIWNLIIYLKDNNLGLDMVNQPRKH